MKKNTLFPLLALCCWLLFPNLTKGQSYPPDYASVFVDLQLDHHPAIIRKVSDTSALVYYYDYTFRKGVIALIDLSMNLKRVFLKDNYTVNDMRITGDHVYFCGTVNNGGRGFVGHVKISSFYNYSTRTVTYYLIDTLTSELNRMVAYTIGGKQKVVAVGRHHFINGGAFPCPYDPITHPYSCMCSFFVEATFDGATIYSPTFNYVPVNLGHNEIISEVIETPNYVALVGHDSDANSTVIHRCNKSGVTLSFLFDHFYHYPSAPYEGLSDYHGCVMKGDTIAIASLSTYYDATGSHAFSTNVRIFDLTTMTNTKAQKVPLNTKSEPFDLVYIPEKGRLVLLQDICLPPHPCDQNMFIHLEPYASTPYSAKCWYESSGLKPFYSLDRLSDNYYLAAGGQYWCMKELMNLTSNRCYISDNFNIESLGVLPSSEKSLLYYTSSVFHIKSENSLFGDYTFYIGCF